MNKIFLPVDLPSYIYREKIDFHHFFFWESILEDECFIGLFENLWKNKIRSKEIFISLNNDFSRVYNIRCDENLVDVFYYLFNRFCEDLVGPVKIADSDNGFFISQESPFNLGILSINKESLLGGDIVGYLKSISQLEVIAENEKNEDDKELYLNILNNYRDRFK